MARENDVQVIELGLDDVVLIRTTGGKQLTDEAVARLREQWGMASERGVAVLDGSVTVTVFKGVKRWAP